MRALVGSVYEPERIPGAGEPSLGFGALLWLLTSKMLVHMFI